MTINGPAPMLLGFFLNAAIDQGCEKWIRSQSKVEEVEKKITKIFEERGLPRPTYQGSLPAGNDGLGLMLLGVSGDEVLSRETYEKIRAATLSSVRGTVQADILKEDQAQNTCIFSTEFALRLMGDTQQHFIDNKVRNFYSVSNLRLSHRRSRGEPGLAARVHARERLHVRRVLPVTRDEHRRLRPEPVVLLLERNGPRVRGARTRGAQDLGTNHPRQVRRQRSLAEAEVPHSNFWSFAARPGDRVQRHPHDAPGAPRAARQLQLAPHDDLRRGDHHATEESVRRALAIQLVISKEFGLSKNENPIQGSFIIEELTDLVEDAVLKEFRSISERGGVLGAMERMYQRSKIQDESLYYETMKHDGSLPIVA